ncbi:MAG TPA: SRPBCC domain-containing protein [Candidatus Acidoferrales bacterium]|nr:SRPBCC domain-containing protein [Candidatus Acidoferrales bacterium]
MIAMATKVEDLALSINEEIHVKAPLAATFESLIEQLGSSMEMLNGEAVPMKIEPWPGGRWYRDLGDGNGHLWGHVQAIKRPTLLEIYGPLMMSYAATSNVQYRLSEEEGGTLIKFHHMAIGMIPADRREGFGKGWAYIAAHAKERAEKLRGGKSTAH